MKSLVACALVLATAGVASAEPMTTIRVNGPAANRVGVTLLGDGYTQAEQGKYAADVDTYVNAFFNQSPFQEYAAYFNVYRVDVVSTESGADHPESGTSRNTALGASYNCGGVQRVICVDLSAVNGVLSRSVPIEARDLVIVLVNDPIYGGSGGSVLVSSTHTDGVEIALHEAGHTFGRLTDEYTQSPPTCNASVEPAEANAALNISRDSIKWAPWILPATPLPSTDTTNGIPGAYVGARYCTAGLYRPTFNSKMRSLGRPFEQINSEAIVKRVYNFVSPIDSVSPSATSVNAAPGSTVDFSVQTPRLTAAPLRIRWTVDGNFAGEGESMRLNTFALAPGSHLVQVEVSDQTTLVRSDPSRLLLATRSWNVTTQAAAADDVRRLFEEFLQRWRTR